MNPDTHNDKEVCQFIDRRFQEQFRNDEEKWTFFSFIDCYLKWCSSKDDNNKLAEQILSVCKKHGYVPQYNVSGWSTFYTDRSRFSKDSKFVISPNVEHTMVIFSGEMRPYAAFFNRRAERVDLSPNGDRLVNFYRDKDNDRSIEVWNTEEFKIIFETDTSLNWIWWVDSESFYYTNKNGNLMKFNGPSSIVDTGIVLDEDEFAFAVDETNKQVLSLGFRICVAELDTGDCYYLDEEMSKDSEIYISKDGFRIFSNGALYRVGEGLEILFESKESCISRYLDPGHGSLSIFGFERDCRGIYADAEGTRYYLDEGGVKSVAAYPRWSHLSLEASELLDKFSSIEPFILEESSLEERIKYVKEKLRSMETVTIVDGGCRDVYIIRPLGMASPFVPKAEVFRFSNLPYIGIKQQNKGKTPFVLNISDIHIVDTALVDVSTLVPKTDAKFNMMGQLGFDIYANETKMDNPAPITKVLLTALPRDEKLYQMSTDEEHFSISTTLREYDRRITFIINDSGEISSVNGSLINLHQMNMICGKPILNSNNVWYSIEADGTCKMLEDVPPYADTALCTGNTVLWKCEGSWHKGNKSIPHLTADDGDKLALVSEDCVMLNRHLGLEKISLTTDDRSIINIYEASYWSVLGMSDTGYLAMVHFVRNDNTVTVDFAELNMNNGTWKNLEGKMEFPVAMSEGLGFNIEHMWGSIFNYIDLRKQKIVKIDSNFTRPTISRYDLTNGKIKRSRNGLRANLSKRWVTPVELNNGLYLIATTEPDEDKTDSEKKKDDESSRKALSDVRPELRIMDPNTGLRFKNGDRYGGLMYGPKGYNLRDRIRPVKVSPDGCFVFATYDHPEISINSFDVKTQKTYPEKPIHGTILEFPAENRVLIGLFNEKGAFTHCQTFDYKLNPIDAEPQKMVFQGTDLYDQLNYEFPDEKEDSEICWSCSEFNFRIYDQCNMFYFQRSEYGKKEIDVNLTYIHHGLIKNNVPWHTKVISEYYDPKINEIKESLKKNLKFASSEDLTVIFDMTGITQRTRGEEYHVTIVSGNKKIQLPIQSPFYVGGEYLPLGCPVSVLKDTFTYSIDKEGKTFVQRCKLTDEGEIVQLNGLEIADDCHYMPLFADEGLLIIMREDRKCFFSENWKDITELDEGIPYYKVGNIFLVDKRGKEYRLMIDGDEYEFKDGKLMKKNNLDRYPSELKMSTGTLEWKEGIFTVRL